ncbi:MAG TPA: hypothetical protein VFA11_02020 [Acidimicrobiales bacterium]|nr:hypothetical protein [Acidimicrobiales bacterium]
MRPEDLLDPPPWAGAAVRAVLHRIDTEAGVRRLRGLIWSLLALAVLGFLVAGADRPADPYLSNRTLAPPPPPHLAPASPPATKPAPPPTLHLTHRP